MPNYDFRTLSPVDLEILVRDLLQEELSLTFQSFTSGRDGGIDLRHARDSTDTIVVQCKHFVESGYDLLFHVLSKKELPKIRGLNPKRYILATSVPLTPRRKDEIVGVLAPFLQSSDDVYGKNDLNNLLGKYDHIERKTIKLWLFSLPLLEEVLHAAVRNFSAAEMERIRENAKLYVQNESFNQAADMLDTHNFCIIAGIPGIGKTILAEMLILHYCRAGFEVIKVSHDIAEAWDLKGRDAKRLFYYDDFLGQSSFTEKLRKNEDQRMIDFIHAIRKTSSAKLILTTREYVLQQAYQQYEKLSREGFSAQKCIVDLSKYTRLNRARILFNHIYFSALPAQYRVALLEDRAYLRIIDHRNYSPRIVRLLTEHVRLRDVPSTEYIQYFMQSMDNPLAIWEHAFTKQISQAARNLLIVFASLPHECFVRDAESAFQSYNLAYAKEFAAAISPQDYRSALKELDGDFLTYEREGTETLMRFQNPSVADFVRQYIFSSEPEFALLYVSATFYEQMDVLWSWTAQRASLGRLIQCDRISAEAICRRLISSPPCRVINVRRGSTTRKEHWPEALENRITLVAELAVRVSDRLLPLVKESTHAIQARIGSGDFDRSGLAKLVEVLCTQKDCSFQPWITAFIATSIEALIDAPRWADDLRPLCRLVQSHSSLFTEETLERVANSIQSVASDVALDDGGLDADSLREEAEAFESLAKIVGADVSADVARLRERAGEREQESSEEDDGIEYSSSESGGGGAATDDDIHSMFSTLDLQP